MSNQYEVASMLSPSQTPSVVRIADTDIAVISYKDQRVITTELMAQVYVTDIDNIKQNYARNKDRFEEGKHYFKLEGDELGDFKSLSSTQHQIDKHTRNLFLWTERGASRHAKMLDTDKAWEIFDQLESAYFDGKPSQDTGPVEYFEARDKYNLAALVKNLSMQTKHPKRYALALHERIRRVANRPTPLPYHVADIPLIAGDLQTIAPYIVAFQAKMDELEKDFIRRVIAKGESDPDGFMASLEDPALSESPKALCKWQQSYITDFAIRKEPDPHWRGWVTDADVESTGGCA